MGVQLKGLPESITRLKNTSQEFPSSFNLGHLLFGTLVLDPFSIDHHHMLRNRFILKSKLFLEATEV